MANAARYDWHEQCKGRRHVPMMFSSAKFRLLAAALFSLGGSAIAAEGGKEAARSAAKEAANAAKDNAKGEAKSAQQSAMDQFRAQAESFSKDHDMLVKQLQAATAENRKAILEKMEERKKEFEARLSALHKQMRDEQRKQRQSGSSKR